MAPSDSSLNSSITAKFVPLQTVITPDLNRVRRKLILYQVLRNTVMEAFTADSLPKCLERNKNVLEVIIIVLHHYRGPFPYRVCTKTHQKGVKRHLLIRFTIFATSYTLSPPKFQNREKRGMRILWFSEEDAKWSRSVTSRWLPLHFCSFFLYDLRITRDMIRSLPVFFLLVYGQQRTTEWTEWEECDYQLEVRHKLQCATLKWFSFR